MKEDLNEREMTVLKSFMNENEVGGKIKSVKHFIGKVFYFIGLLFITTIGLVIMFLGLGLLDYLLDYFPMLLFYLFCISIVLKLIDK